METRSKKKCRQLLAVKDRNPPLNSDQDFYRYLPPEIMEMIIENLNEKPRELLKYRVVNSYWASVVDSYLERKVLSNWRRWDNGLKENLKREYCYPMVDPKHLLFPTFSVVSTATSPSARSPSVYYPLKLFNHTRNPFPTGSLTISLVLPTQRITRVDGRGCDIAKMEKLLSHFGHHLTSFVFQDTIMTFPQMESVMASLPNLKALTISMITLRKASKKVEGSQTSLIPSNLTHIRVVKGVSSEIIQWLVDRCAHQLVGLDVDAAELKPFKRPTTASGSLVPYKELKYLKIYNPSREFLHETEELPVKYLSIICNEETEKEQEEQVTAMDIKKFICLFVKTLVELNFHLDWTKKQLSLESWKEDDDADQGFFERFPKINKFCFRGPENSNFDNVCWEYFMRYKRLHKGVCKRPFTYLRWCIHGTDVFYNFE